MSLALLLCLLFASHLHAQVNIEHYRDRPGVTGGANYSFNTDLGNVDLTNSGGAGNVVYNTASSTTLCLFNGDVGFHVDTDPPLEVKKADVKVSTSFGFGL